ncbi:hypothetical protein [Methylocystis hirsuta]|uniref:hypothetical protein n=1 Tax=Methylocystis hirsuta TaxID=369798 RepID=UPI001475F72C|nr:hypothetical protein [Methylocystis hirsuta]
MSIEALVFYFLLVVAISADLTLVLWFGSLLYRAGMLFSEQRLTARSSAVQVAEQPPAPHSARDTACHIRAGAHARRLLRNSRFRMFGEEHPKHENEIRRISRRSQVNRRTNVRDNHLTYGAWAALQIQEVTR